MDCTVSLYARIEREGLELAGVCSGHCLLQQAQAMSTTNIGKAMSTTNNCKPARYLVQVRLTRECENLWKLPCPAIVTVVMSVKGLERLLLKCPRRGFPGGKTSMLPGIHGRRATEPQREE